MDIWSITADQCTPSRSCAYGVGASTRAPAPSGFASAALERQSIQFPSFSTKDRAVAELGFASSDGNPRRMLGQAVDGHYVGQSSTSS
jgi:hypothetical protein